MAYNFTAQWLKGANNKATDTLSCHPHCSPNQGDDLAEYEIDTNNDPMITNRALSITELRVSTLNQIEQETYICKSFEDMLMKIQYTTLSKTSSSTDFQTKSCPYLTSLNHFGVSKTILVLMMTSSCLAAVYSSLRATILSCLHDAHQGISRSQARARLTIYWLGIDRDIKNFVQGCHHCQDHLPSNARSH